MKVHILSVVPSQDSGATTLGVFSTPEKAHAHALMDAKGHMGSDIDHFVNISGHIEVRDQGNDSEEWDMLYIIEDAIIDEGL